jgi:hypothetical protein
MKISSGMLHGVLWGIPIIASKELLWKVGQYLPDYTSLQHRRRQQSCDIYVFVILFTVT